ncbi:uncharacterized protein NECHADRAFT_82260 [Fusarium vanettenii 77-13-4]|uniref:Uncharacterized protein n=1 Tax=Fusarium vanettenii (strain ATCC MYA-4622 / CBS 123669 / FGSC 9596 / NRRL 45880 / 77-13-4) TaxID=660122 RepID=C7ZNK0_FUSV7|nr:uncharacterized protein NECHADRAFT_82260 [Fusarium vanettenii 77-13-4]EEU34411.1 predicted protein [Fusarium vanettenii 77-13-4]
MDEEISRRSRHSPERVRGSRVSRTRQSPERLRSPPAKRRRRYRTQAGSSALEEAIASAFIPTQNQFPSDYEGEPRSEEQFAGLLLSSTKSPLSTFTVHQQDLIINLIQERARDTEGSTSRLEKRLDKAYATLEWWETVGCEFCFVMNGNTQPGHAMEQCDRWHGCDKARSILKWLESLSIPKFLGDPGSCSMCMHTWFPCRDICLSQSIHDARSKQDKARLVKELQSKPSFDGHCKRKPVMRRVIAALCSYDDQFFAKMLAKLASDNDKVDLFLERSARAWFEHRIPHKDSWIPRLLFVFEALTVGFYVRENYRLGLPPFDNLPLNPPGVCPSNVAPTRLDALGSTPNRPDGDIVVKRWAATIDWWWQKCSFCIGNGRKGEGVFHNLRECVHGGTEAMETEFGNAIYAERRAPDTACYNCFLPRQICGRWSNTRPGGWIERDFESTCRYGKHLLRDTIIGLYQSHATSFMDDMRNAAAKWYENQHIALSLRVDDEMVVDFLLQGFTDQGIGGIEMMRQLALWSRTVWYHKQADELLPPDDEGGHQSQLSDTDTVNLHPSALSRSNWPTGLRHCESVSLAVRSARAKCSVQEELDGSLIHRYHNRLLNPSRLAVTISTWSKQDISLWCERRHWESPNPHRWRENWRDDQSDHLVNEDKVQKQLERWSVRCPLCLLYRDPACDDHLLSTCPRVEGSRARSIRARLWERIVELQANGIQGYGPVPWCGDCSLPRSCCPAWANQSTTDIASEWDAPPWGGDKYACQSSLARGWQRQDGSRCEFREVVVNTVSAMCAFSLSGVPGTDTHTFWDQIEAWRNQSHIRFNQHWGTEGWLLSPMPWGSQDVMVMLCVFCRLDVVVEDLWIEKEVDRRRAELNLPSPEMDYIIMKQQPQPYLDPRKSKTVAKRDAPDEEARSLLRSNIQEALDVAEYEGERSFGYWEDAAYLSTLGARLRAWRRGGIRCQLCLTYEWSETCYLHDMEACTLRSESKSAMTLLHRWSGLRGAEEGEGKQCLRCRFPNVVCRPINYEDVGGNRGSAVGEGSVSCCGVETLCRTVAALLTVADGVLGDMVIQKEMGKESWDKDYDRLSREWMGEQNPNSSLLQS